MLIIAGLRFLSVQMTVSVGVVHRNWMAARLLERKKIGVGWVGFAFQPLVDLSCCNPGCGFVSAMDQTAGRI